MKVAIWMTMQRIYNWKICLHCPGAVVTKDVPDYALMAGVPAKQRRWMCECGERLTKKGQKTKEMHCQHCGKTYAFNEIEVVIESEE